MIDTYIEEQTKKIIDDGFQQIWVKAIQIRIKEEKFTDISALEIIRLIQQRLDELTQNISKEVE